MRIYLQEQIGIGKKKFCNRICSAYLFAGEEIAKKLLPGICRICRMQISGFKDCIKKRRQMRNRNFANKGSSKFFSIQII